MILTYFYLMQSPNFGSPIILINNIATFTLQDQSYSQPYVAISGIYVQLPTKFNEKPEFLVSHNHLEMKCQGLRALRPGRVIGRCNNTVHGSS